MALYRSKKIKSGLIFVVAAILMTLLYPSKLKFKYDYSIGQPWRYEGVLTAPYSFPIYKSEAQKVQERDSIERTKISYYTQNATVKISEKNQISKDFMERKLSPEVTSDYIQYIHKVLDEIYDRGILPNDAYDLLSSQENGYIFVVDDRNVAVRRDTSEIFNARRAYDYAIHEAPAHLKRHVLQQVSLEQYLISNLDLDLAKTNQMQSARLATVTDVVGNVQKGERIVGTGDMVTPEIYQVLEGYRTAFEHASTTSTERVALVMGQFFLILFLFLMLFCYLLAFREELLKQIKNTLFLVLNVSLLVALTYVLVPIEPAVTYMIPFSIVAIQVRVFIDSRTAAITHLVTVLLAALVVPSPLQFVVIQLIAGQIVLVTLRNLSQRSDLFRTSFATLFGMIISYYAMLIAGQGLPESIDWNTLFYLVINFIFLTFAYLMVYGIERLFGYVSSISLVELADINKPLLRQLSEVAPGTFQHSLNVSTLASEAIGEIGGDVRLVRSGALYHDIGKMKNPTYFTENQGANNPHDRLSYDQSARIIIKHVTDGIEMAEKAKLPKPIIDFIRTHHGLGMTKYFYIKYKNENPDAVIDESIFHYPGPNPWTKEQGVMMLADAVEASSRSLKEITEQVLIDHVNKIVDGIMADGYLKNTPLTFRDIETTKYIFIDKLRNMYHSRIDYPELRRSPNATEEQKQGEDSGQ
ncbi:HDIG domain-containing metalloprotein [uncultured Porphyromonas sp.]|uniref:HD family phosphohydrolase n=1 Tax=uncultured Porphyromonas sp. TaxID=159274 RepID=UPI00262EFEE8|nr:HDIG domain-containing metalloprotein [uncultured Porphyromonas sp.]